MWYLLAAYTQITCHMKWLFSKCACVLMVTSDWIFRDAFPGSKVSGVEVISWFAVWRSCQGYLDHLSINRSSASCFGSVNTWPLAVMISPLTRPLVSLLCRARVSTFRLCNTDLVKQTWQPWLRIQQGSVTDWENQVESTWMDDVSIVIKLTTFPQIIKCVCKTCRSCQPVGSEVFQC